MTLLKEPHRTHNGNGHVENGVVKKPSDSTREGNTTRGLSGLSHPSINYLRRPHPSATWGSSHKRGRERLGR
jgi:hypothetical protein